MKAPASAPGLVMDEEERLKEGRGTEQVSSEGHFVLMCFTPVQHILYINEAWTQRHTGLDLFILNPPIFRREILLKGPEKLLKSEDALI